MSRKLNLVFMCNYINLHFGKVQTSLYLDVSLLGAVSLKMITGCDMKIVIFSSDNVKIYIHVAQDARWCCLCFQRVHVVEDVGCAADIGETLGA